MTSLFTPQEEELKNTDIQAKKKGVGDSKKRKVKEEEMEKEKEVTVTKDEQNQPEQQAEDQKECKNQAVGEEGLTTGVSNNQTLKVNVRRRPHS